MEMRTSYFYGNKVSDYGLKHGYVDYATLAKSFDAVLNNDIMSLTNGVIGYWEQESGMIDNSEEIEELQEKLEELENEYNEMEELENEERLEELKNEIAKLEVEIQDLENQQWDEPEVYQWYIVDYNGATILKDIDEIVYYNEDLNMYLWGVTHYGTGWDYVLTNIKINKQ